MLILHGVTVGLFLLLGGLFSRGRAGFLLAGTDAEPSLALCRRAGRLLFLLAGCWRLLLLSELLRQRSSSWALAPRRTPPPGLTGLARLRTRISLLSFSVNI